MATPAPQRRPRISRFGERFGCASVVLFLLALGVSGVFAWRRPLPGLAVLAAVVGVGALLLRYARRRERQEAFRAVERLRAVAPPSGDAWPKLLEDEGLGRLVGGLRGRVRPAVRLETHHLEGTPAVGQSRLGGQPDLPEDLAWPEHDGLPMMFLAQLDLTELARAAPGSGLPDAGHLFFFYSLSQPWGFDPKDSGGCRVLHGPSGVSLTPTTAPATLPPEGRFESCALSFVAYEDLPELDEDEAEPLSEDEAERYVELRSYLSCGGDGPAHKVLGFADPVQGPMELECQLVTSGIYCGDSSGYEGPRAATLKAGLSEWRLLLQLDSDDRARMMWGDLGRLYFWMRERDLREHRFDRAWLIQQCH